MTVAKGTHNIGTSDGKVLVKTYKEGLGAAVAHDLLLEATDWSGTADIDPDDPSASKVSVTIDLGSLGVVSTLSGEEVKASDKSDIKKNITKTIGQGDATFESSGVSGSGSSLRLAGTLTMAGKSSPVTLEVNAGDDGHVTATTSFKQSAFGFKPFSAMFGALKVKDEVGVELDLQLPTA
jgi:polyisoprenoid-binding protein YceI